MRPSKFSIIVTYIMAIAAVVLYVTAWLHMGDPATATWYIAQACFLLLLNIWTNVCS
jgi:heme/copper-type cytochrome/quinol oxidase subunit 4